MKIVKKSISLVELIKIAEQRFGNLVKAVVDVEKEIIAIDAELHADEEALLLKEGSKQENLWGINIYPKVKGNKWIAFDSMINLRPSQDNLSREVKNSKIRKRIIKIVSKLIKNDST